ncbi:MAG: condensation domain-containing protein, partial [Psychrosphaera sp.]|nr:condensation domain-containing protein [Psychrosphaera sp.]
PDGSALQGEYVAPETPAEQALVDIWAQLLKIDAQTISTSASFFALGGHSLLAISTKTGLNPAGLDVDIAEILNAVSLKALGLHIRTLGEVDDDFIAPQNLIGTISSSAAITPEQLNLIDLNTEELHSIVSQVPGGESNIADIYALSPLQQGMLFYHMTSTDDDIYLSYFILKLNTKTLLNDLLDALNILVERHDTLRTIFYWTGLSVPAQVVLKQCELIVSHVELDEYGSEKEAIKQLETHRERRISLHNGPLFVIKVGTRKCQDGQGQEFFILGEHHHLIMDHIGLDIMVEELGVIMQNGMQNNRQALPPITPYRNMVAYANTQSLEGKNEAYFKQQFADFDQATVLFSQDTDQPERKIERLMDKATARRLRQLAITHQTNVGALFHVAWALVAGKCTNGQDVAFGTVLSGRLNNYATSQRTMGLAINTLPVRVYFTDDSASTVLTQ